MHEIVAPINVVCTNRGKRSMRPNCKIILDMLDRAGAPVSSATLADMCGVPRRTVQRHLAFLVDSGAVERDVLTDTPRRGNWYLVRYRRAVA